MLESLVFTPASDCWMYAVVLWELFSLGVDPWANETHQQVLECRLFSHVLSVESFTIKCLAV